MLPSAPVEAKATALSRPLRPARRRLPLANFTFSVFEAPGAMLKRTLPSWRVTFSPASLTCFAVRTASEPVELPDAVAGELTLIDAMPRFTLSVPPRIVTGGVRFAMGGGVGVRRPVDGLEAVDDVELPDVGHD